jgi:hypothetical protein
VAQPKDGGMSRLRQQPIGWLPETVYSDLGNVLIFAALTWVVAHAVFAPGKITPHRVQGTVIVYLNLALIFASI